MKTFQGKRVGDEIDFLRFGVRVYGIITRIGYGNVWYDALEGDQYKTYPGETFAFRTYYSLFF